MSVEEIDFFLFERDGINLYFMSSLFSLSPCMSRDILESSQENELTSFLSVLSPVDADSFLSEEKWLNSPVFPNSSKNEELESPTWLNSKDKPNSPMSPLDLLNDEPQTPTNSESDYSAESPLISNRSVSPISVEQESPAVQNDTKQNSTDLLDCQDLLDFSRIMSKLEERAGFIDKIRHGLLRTESSAVDIQLPYPVNAEINKRVMLAALYQRMAKTIRKLDLNEYAIVVPPAVRDASRFLNQGFHPVGVTAWKVGEFSYDTNSSMWSPYHPRFSR
jgi:hypothetical protein